MPERPVQLGLGPTPTGAPPHGASPLRRGEAQRLLHRGTRGAQAGLTGLVPRLEQGDQALMVLWGTDAGELTPAAGFSPRK